MCIFNILRNKYIRYSIPTHIKNTRRIKFRFFTKRLKTLSIFVSTSNLLSNKTILKEKALECLHIIFFFGN